MTRGRQRLKASPLCPCSRPMLEGLGDFLRPPTRRADVERSRVPRAADTALVVSRLQTGPATADNSDTGPHRRVGASQVRGSHLLCVSAVKRVCELSRTRVTNNHCPRCPAGSPRQRKAAGPRDR